MKEKGKRDLRSTIFQKKNRRGLSTVIVTLLFILLSLVAVGIVWVVVSNLLKSGTQQASSGFGQLLVSLELQNVNINPNGDIGVSVKRNVGQGDLTGIAFIISDGTNSPVIKKDTTLQELGTQTFTITTSELGSNFGLVKEVSIVPVISSTMGNVVDKEEISNKDVLKGLGAVSWWKLDGNANDEIGGNNGNVIGNVNFVEGKYGNAGDFDRNSSYITVADASNLRITAYSVGVWIKPNGVPNEDWKGIVGKPGRNYQFWLNNAGFVHHRFRNSTDTNAGAPDTPAGSILWDQWNNVVIVNDGTIAKTYINGIEKASGATGGSLIVNNTPLYINRNLDGGNGNYFKGQIDEVILFNRSLTAQQIKLLYQLDLTSS